MQTRPPARKAARTLYLVVLGTLTVVAVVMAILLVTNNQYTLSFAFGN